MDHELREMIDFVARAAGVYHPGPFWKQLGGEHIAALESRGYENFKRTVNIRYFDWRPLGILRHQFGAVLRQWASRPRFEPFRARFLTPVPFNPVAAWVYRTYVAMYADLLRRRDPLEFLSTIEEPRIGNPFIVRHRGANVSQDICNSIHEFYNIHGFHPDRSRRIDICELGAGYGRLGYLTLLALPAATYTIVDIPPSLYLAQRYLAEVFPDAHIFRFRPFDRFEDVREEFEASKIRILAPSQIEQLPAKTFDCFVNISSLHEMTREQIENYFVQIDRLCRGRFYTKQFRSYRATAKTSLWREKAAFRENDYPVPSSWRTLYHRTHEIQRLFFEALYELPSQEPPASTV